MFTIITVLALLCLWLALSFNRFRMSRGGKTFAPARDAEEEVEVRFTLGETLQACLRWLAQSIREYAKGQTFAAWPAKVKELALWRLPFIEKWLLIILYATFLYLAASGFFWAIFIRRGLYGVPLLLHFTAGVIFAVCLTLTGILKARRYFLNPRPLYLPSATEGRALVRNVKSVWKISLSTKDVTSVLFWLFLLTGLSLAVSALFPMMPWFPYKGQMILFGWHRWSALISLLAAIAFAELEFFRPRSEA